MVHRGPGGFFPFLLCLNVRVIAVHEVWTYWVSWAMRRVVTGNIILVKSCTNVTNESEGRLRLFATGLYPRPWSVRLGEASEQNPPIKTLSSWGFTPSWSWERRRRLSERTVWCVDGDSTQPSKTGREGRGQATKKSVPARRLAWVWCRCGCRRGATPGGGANLGAGLGGRGESGTEAGRSQAAMEAGFWAGRAPGAGLGGRGEPQGCAPRGGAADAIAPLPAGGGLVRRAGPRLVPRPSPSSFCSPVPAWSPPCPRGGARGTRGGVPGMRRRRRAETMLHSWGDAALGARRDPRDGSACRPGGRRGASGRRGGRGLAGRAEPGGDPAALQSAHQRRAGVGRVLPVLRLPARRGRRPPPAPPPGALGRADPPVEGRRRHLGARHRRRGWAFPRDPLRPQEASPQALSPPPATLSPELRTPDPGPWTLPPRGPHFPRSTEDPPPGAGPTRTLPYPSLRPSALLTSQSPTGRPWPRPRALPPSRPPISRGGPPPCPGPFPPAPPSPPREAGDAGQVCGQAPPEWVGAWARVLAAAPGGGRGSEGQFAACPGDQPAAGRGGAGSVVGRALVGLAAEPRLDALGAAQVRPHLVPGRCVFAGSCQQIMLFRDGQRYSLGWKCKEIWALRRILLFGEKWRHWLKTHKQYNTISLYVKIYCNKKQACKVKSWRDVK